MTREAGEIRKHVAAVARCVGTEIARLRRGAPHWSWLNRYFRDARAALKTQGEEA